MRGLQNSHSEVSGFYTHGSSSPPNHGLKRMHHAYRGSGEFPILFLIIVVNLFLVNNGKMSLNRVPAAGAHRRGRMRWGKEKEVGAGRVGGERQREDAVRVREINAESEVEGEERERRAACQKPRAFMQPKGSGDLGRSPEGGPM